MKTLNKLHRIILHVTRYAVKAKDRSVMLHFLVGEVEINNALSKNCNVVDTKVWCMV